MILAWSNFYYDDHKLMIFQPHFPIGLCLYCKSPPSHPINLFICLLSVWTHEFLLWNSLLFWCSNCLRFASDWALQAGSHALWHVPKKFFSTSIHFSAIWYFSIILYLPCTSLGIIHFSKEHFLFSGQWYLRTRPGH